MGNARCPTSYYVIRQAIMASPYRARERNDWRIDRAYNLNGGS